MLLAPERVACGVHSASKKRVLEQLSKLVVNGQPALTATVVFESLIARERLGSTGIGHGVAIPHGRLNGDFPPIGAFLQLSSGIDFDAIDAKPVDILFALLVPQDCTDEHLRILASLAAMFEDEKFCLELRQAEAPQDILALLTDWEAKS